MDLYLKNIINSDLSRNFFSTSVKVASVRPIFKKDDRTKIKKYRTVSLLGCILKIYENILNK